MAVKVLVNSPPKNRVSINNQNKSTIRTMGISGATSTVSAVLDISDADQNEVPVWDETAGKLVVKVLPIVDGGTF